MSFHSRMNRRFSEKRKSIENDPEFEAIYRLWPEENSHKFTVGMMNSHMCRRDLSYCYHHEETVKCGLFYRWHRQAVKNHWIHRII